MSELVYEPVIKVDTYDGEKSVKGLKDEIKKLQDHILNLTEGTDEYAFAVKKLQDDQRDLNSVMALTKQTATALDGSYDALVHQMGLLKKEWRATNDEARRNELSEQIASINTQLKEMDAELGNFQRNVGNYQSALDGMDTSTKSFKESLGQMNDSIEPTKAKFESVQKISSGVASGFAAVQGAAALLGSEGEDLQKVFVKVQSAMAIAQGVGGLGDLVEGVGKATVAFEGLGDKIKAVSKTLGKTGWVAVIMVAITAIMLITDAIKKKKEAVDGLDASLSKLEKRNENIIESDKERARQLEREIKLMAANGATEEEILKKRLEYNQLYENAAKDSYNEAQKQYFGLKNSQEMGIRGADGKKISDEEVARAKEAYDTANAILKDYEEKRKDILNDITIAQINAKKKIEETPLPTIPTLSTDIEVADEPIEKLDTSVQMQEEGEVFKKVKASMLAIEQTYAGDVIGIEERKLARLKELHQEALNVGDYESQLALQQAIADQEVALNQAKNDALVQSDEEAAQKRIDTINKISASMSAAADVTQGILEITQAAYEKDGEISAKEAKKIKGMQIAIATMNMLAGITAALSGAFTLKSGPWDIALAAVQAATIAASGTANIMKIKNTDLTGSVSGGAQAAVTPNSNIYGTDLPMSYVHNVTGQSEIDAINQPQRVYILESDIQDSNNRVKTRIEESTF